MKIIGFRHRNPGQGLGSQDWVMEVKGDSALLNQRKPLFLPDWTSDVRYTPAVVVRICRLGKHIQPKFATRYYDAIAPAMDVVAWDKLAEDPALAVSWDGAFVTSLPSDKSDPLSPKGERDNISEQDICEAIARASEAMTLRMGDMVFVDKDMEAIPLKAEDVIEDGSLYCKVK